MQRAVAFLAVSLAACTSAEAVTQVFISQNVGRSVATGFYTNQPTKKEAFAKGRADCQRNHGDNCKPLGPTFHNACFGVARQTGRHNGAAIRFNLVAERAGEEAVAACQKMGVKCELVATACDTVKEQRLICIQPIFSEERRLYTTLDGSADTTQKVVNAINYLHTKYCRTVDDAPDNGQQEWAEGNCSMRSATYRGEKVYWGFCDEK